MSTPILRCCIALLLLGFGLFWMRPAQATISCSNTTMSPVAFGPVNPLSSQTDTQATLGFTCKNSGGLLGTTYSATVCFSIGEPAGGPTDPRQMSDAAGDILTFQLYLDSARTQPWGSEGFGTFRTPMQVNITLAPGASRNYSATLYARVTNGQTTVPPAAAGYSDNYMNGDTATSINQQSGSTAPGTCGGGYVSGLVFPFLVSASVASQCTVSAGTPLTLGSAGGVAAGTTNNTGSTTFSVTCTNNTSYNIGLSPSNNSLTGAGLMSGTGGNTNKVPYQLNQKVTGTVWGNTATSTSVGNGVAGSGSGSAKSLTVYATAPGSDFKPDTYSDIVTINVNY